MKYSTKQFIALLRVYTDMWIGLREPNTDKKKLSYIGLKNRLQIIFWRSPEITRCNH